MEINTKSEIQTPRSVNVGSVTWKNNTIITVKKSDDLLRKSNSIKRKDTDLLSRTILIDLNNQKVRECGRSLRQTVNALRETMIDVNFQIRSLNRLNENFEKIKFEVDKKIKKSNLSCFIRSGKPTRERLRDDASMLLKEELQTLREVRRSVESKQWRVIGMENKLADNRKILTVYLRRKSKALDLLPDSTLHQKHFIHYREEILPELKEIQDILRDSCDLINQSKTFVQGGEQFLKEVNETITMSFGQTTRALKFTISESKHLQKELKNAIDRNRRVSNKSIKTFNDTKHSWLELKGPESAKYLSTNERIDRPIMKFFNARSRSNLPEITLQERDAASYLSQLRNISNNIGQLKVAEMRLNEDIYDKSIAMHIDKQIFVIRNMKHLL